MTKVELEQIFNERIAAVLRIASDLVQKKRESLQDWGWDPSGDDESRARGEAHNAAQDAMRSALSEIADVCYEVAEKISAKAEEG